MRRTGSNSLLRYEAALCERQFRRVDPDNRLVAAELERRWEGALGELQTAEANDAQCVQPMDSAESSLCAGGPQGLP